MSGFGITVGYHRFLSHRAYDAGLFVKFCTLFFGAAAFEMSALGWCSQHRDHHKYVDTDKDPYDITRGFFYAHMGWIMFWLRNIDYDNVKDLKKDALIMHQHKHFQIWALGFGVIMPAIIGALYGHVIESLLFVVAARMFIVFHVTFFINSFAHTFGKATYDKSISAKDNWLGAILTGGEGYHSFHHRFPSDYRNGVKWYHWDPSKWVIAGMSFIGLTKGLKRATEFQILSAI